MQMEVVVAGGENKHAVGVVLAVGVVIAIKHYGRRNKYYITNTLTNKSSRKTNLGSQRSDADNREADDNGAA